MQQKPWPAVYEDELGPAMFEPWSVQTIKTATPRAGDHVLDVACGTGVVARRAAQYVGSRGKVVGLDINPEMIAFARSLPTTSPTAVEWIEGNAQHLPFPDATFDLVYCQGGLQFMPDSSTAIREMHRVLKPLSRIVLMLFNDIEQSPGFAILAEKIAPYVDPRMHQNIVTPFVLANAHAVQTVVKEAGFQRISLRQETVTAHFRSAEHFVRARLESSPARSFVNEETLARIMHDVVPALQPYETEGGLSFPMDGYLLLAYKW